MITQPLPHTRAEIDLSEWTFDPKASAQENARIGRLVTDALRIVLCDDNTSDLERGMPEVVLPWPDPPYGATDLLPSLMLHVILPFGEGDTVWAVNLGDVITGMLNVRGDPAPPYNMTEHERAAYLTFADDLQAQADRVRAAVAASRLVDDDDQELVEE